MGANHEQFVRQDIVTPMTAPPAEARYSNGGFHLMDPEAERLLAEDPVALNPRWEYDDPLPPSRTLRALALALLASLLLGSAAGLLLWWLPQ